MPFDFAKYDAKCATLDGDALQREWEHYTRLISGAATSTAVSGLAVPLTLGMSTIGVGLAAPAIHNARKKREIIERHLQRHGRTHHTRKRDVVTAGAISGTIGLVTLGLAPIGADAICNSAAEHGISYIAENELGVKLATHLALDAAAVAAEETHMHSVKEREAWKAYTQAVQQGKNPALPSSDLKFLGNGPVSTIDATANQCLQVTPAISVTHPASGGVPAQNTAIYNSAQATYNSLQVDDQTNRRHSICTSSTSTEQALPQHSCSHGPGHIMYGASTAISAPMVAGQRHSIQPAPQLSDLPSRPVSAILVQRPPAESLSLTPTYSYIPQQPPSVHQAGLSPQYLAMQMQRPRAHSAVSSDDIQTYDSCQQAQYRTNIDPTQPLPPASPSPMPTPSAVSSPSPWPSPKTPKAEYFPPSVSAVEPYNPSDYQKEQTYKPGYCQPQIAQYNPNDYTVPRQHGSYFTVHIAQSTTNDVYSHNHQSQAWDHQNQPGRIAAASWQVSAITSGAYTPANHYMISDLRQSYSYPQEKQSVPPSLYFPPPPKAQ